MAAISILGPQVLRAPDWLLLQYRLEGGNSSSLTSAKKKKKNIYLKIVNCRRVVFSPIFGKVFVRIK